MNKKDKKDKWQVQEDQIIKDCQNQNIDAYKMIYDRYEQPLLHTALRIMGQKQDAEDVISRLPERMRACFVLFAVEGIPQSEIANILNLTVRGVKSKWEEFFTSKVHSAPYMSGTSRET